MRPFRQVAVLDQRILERAHFKSSSVGVNERVEIGSGDDALHRRAAFDHPGVDDARRCSVGELQLQAHRRALGARR